MIDLDLSVLKPSLIAWIMACIKGGVNKGADSHWIVRLESGEFAYIAGNWPGREWDWKRCYAAVISLSLEAVLRQVPEPIRDGLCSQLGQVY